MKAPYNHAFQATPYPASATFGRWRAGGGAPERKRQGAISAEHDTSDEQIWTGG